MTSTARLSLKSRLNGKSEEEARTSLLVPVSSRKSILEEDGARRDEGAAPLKAGQAAFRRSITKIRNASVLTGLGERMNLGGGALVLGPGIPRDLRQLAGPALAPEGPSASFSASESAAPIALVPESLVPGSDRRSARRLKRLTDPRSRMDFMKDHPFFRDTSMTLRMRLAPQLVKRNAEGTKDVIEQGAEPAGSMDYLFLTAPDMNTKVEVIFDGRPIAMLSGSAVCGQEVIFGISRTFIFGVRMVTGLASAGAMWVIPRSFITRLLQKEAHRADAAILQERAEAAIAAILRGWYTQPAAQVRLRLFENADHAFKMALVQAVSIGLSSGGTVLRQRGAEGKDSCFCVFRGEASARIPGESECIAKLTHGAGTSAWAAWWGMLEVLGICSKCQADVVADTDCIVWYLSPDSLRLLRKQFPTECRLFDKVCREHVKLLQPTAPKVSETPLFKGMGPELLRKLAAGVRAEVFGVGAAAVLEGDSSNDLLFLARGRVCVRRQHAERGQPAGGRRSAQTQSPVLGVVARNPMLEKVIVYLEEGAFFGVSTVLGYSDERTASVVCETVCDVRILPGSMIVEFIDAHPGIVPRLLDVAQHNGCRLRCEAPGRPAHEDLDLLLPLNLSNEGMSTFNADMARLVTVRGQLLEKQGSGAETFYIFVEGIVEVEVDGKCVAEIRAPALLGEQALLQPGEPHQASLRSKGVCCFRKLGAERARRLLECMPADRERLLLAAHDSLEDFLALTTGARTKTAGAGSAAGHGSGREASEDSLSENGEELVARRRSSLGPEEGDDGIHFIDGQPTTVFLSRFFKESRQGFLDFILQGMFKVIYTDKEVIMKEGDEGDFAVCIHRGSGTVEVGGVRVGEVKAGSLIGEAAVFGAGAKRNATVRAVGLVSAYKIARTLLLAAFEEFPEERKHIENLARLRGLTNRVLTAAKKPEVEEQSGNPSQHRRLSRFHDANSFIFGSVSRAWGSGTTRFSNSVSLVMRQNSMGRTARAARQETQRATLPAESLRARTRRLPDGARHKSLNAETSRASSLVSSGSCSSAEAAGEAESHSRCSTPKASMKRQSTESMQDAKPGSRHRTAAVSSKSSHTGSETSQALPCSEAPSRSAEWANRRRRLIEEAPLKRDQRLARRGDMLPLVPSAQGYQDPAAGDRHRLPASWRRLQKAAGLYAPPVWHEVFGV